MTHSSCALYRLPVSLAFIACLMPQAGAQTGAQDGTHTVVLSSVKDNTIYEAQGFSNALSPQMYAGPGGNDLRRALVQFDVEGAVPVGSTVVHAALTLHVLSEQASGFDPHFALPLTASWGEGTSSGPAKPGAPATRGDVTWFHRFHPGEPWTSPGGDFTAGAVLLATGAVGDALT